MAAAGWKICSQCPADQFSGKPAALDHPNASPADTVALKRRPTAHAEEVVESELQ